MSFQVNLCVVQLLAYCSIVKMMTISVQLQTTFMNLHRVWFVWTGCLCMERSWWVFKRYAYMFCTVSAPTKTYKSNSTVTFWLWAKVPCCWHHPWHPGSWCTVRGMWFLGQGSFNLTMPLNIYLWIAICFTGHVPQWLRQALKTPVLSLHSFPYVHGSSLISSLCSSFLLHLHSHWLSILMSLSPILII